MILETMNHFPGRRLRVSYNVAASRPGRATEWPDSDVRIISRWAPIRTSESKDTRSLWLAWVQKPAMGLAARMSRAS